MNHTEGRSTLQIARISQPLYEDLQASGLSDEMIQRANISAEWSHEAIEDALRHKRKWGLLAVGAPATRFPYHNLDGSLRSYTRFKALYPRRDGEGKLIKYESPRDQLNQLYFLPGTGEQLRDVLAPIIITEGEKKTLKLNQEGHLAIGIGGAWNWSDGGKPRRLVPDFNLITWMGRRVILIVDSDGATNRMVRMGFEELARKLRERGAIVAMVILPGHGDNKVGADDFLILHGSAALDDLIRSANRAADKAIFREKRFAAWCAEQQERAQLLKQQRVSSYSVTSEVPNRVSRTSPVLPQFDGRKCSRRGYGNFAAKDGSGEHFTAPFPCRCRSCRGCGPVWVERHTIWYAYKIDCCEQQLYRVSVPVAAWDSFRKQLSRKANDHKAEYLLAEVSPGELEGIVTVPVEGAAAITKDEAKSLMQHLVTNARPVKKPFRDFPWKLPKDRKKSEQLTVLDVDANIATARAIEEADALAESSDLQLAAAGRAESERLRSLSPATMQVDKYRCVGRSYKVDSPHVMTVLDELGIAYQYQAKSDRVEYEVPCTYTEQERKALCRGRVSSRGW